MNPENRTWRPIDPEAGSLPEGLESALGDGASVSACVVVLVDSEIDSEWGAQATLAVARRWAASGRRVILVDACLDCPVLHQSAGIENGEGVCSMGHRFRESRGLSERASIWSLLEHRSFESPTF